MSDKKVVSEKLLSLWEGADAVCFDVDSTVITGEGLDDLADYCGCGEEVALWTAKAMGEGISFRESFAARLDIFKPSKQKLQEFLTKHPPILTKDIQELVSLLISKGVAVYLVSGGLHTIVDQVAKDLDIPLDRVFANRLLHNEKGEYIGFDEDEPTSASHGKAKVAQLLKTNFDYNSMVMIGDGITDLEAYPPADLFIGFGGNKMRKNVYEKSPWFVYTFRELIGTLN